MHRTFFIKNYCLHHQGESIYNPLAMSAKEIAGAPGMSGVQMQFGNRQGIKRTVSRLENAEGTVQKTIVKQDGIKSIKVDRPNITKTTTIDQAGRTVETIKRPNGNTEKTITAPNGRVRTIVRNADGDVIREQNRRNQTRNR